MTNFDDLEKATDTLLNADEIPKPTNFVTTLETAIEIGFDPKRITDTGVELPAMNTLIQINDDGSWEVWGD